METRANYVLIGLFTLSVIVGIFGFVWWFQRLGTGEAKAQYEIYFDGPVAGLRTGATVNFNGIRVGEVRSLALVPNVPRAVVAIVEVSNSTPVRTDTKVALEYQGLTGIASVAMTGGNPDAPMFTAPKRGERAPRQRYVARSPVCGGIDPQGGGHHQHPDRADAERVSFACDRCTARGWGNRPAGAQYRAQSEAISVQ